MPQRPRGANAERHAAPPERRPLQASPNQNSHLQMLRRRSEPRGCPAALEQCGAQLDFGTAASSSGRGVMTSEHGAVRHYSNGRARAR